MMLALSTLPARVSARRSASVTLAIGATAIGLGHATGAVVPGGITWAIVISVIVGTGLAFAFSAMPVLILAVIPASQVATAGGVNLLIRSIGATASSAVLGTLLGAMAKRVSGHGCPQMVPSPDALKLAFLVACCAAFGGAIVAGLSMTSPEARQIRSGT